MLHWFIDKGDDGSTNVVSAYRGVYFDPTRTVVASHAAGAQA